MKEFIANLVSVINGVVNACVIVCVCNFLIKSELSHLGNFSDMVGGSNWYYENPGTMLFAYSLPVLAIILAIVSIFVTILSVTYLKLKKEEILGDDEYSSKNVTLAKITISMMLSSVICLILGVALYRVLPMSIVFIILAAVIYRCSFVERLIYRMGLGKNNKSDK